MSLRNIFRSPRLAGRNLRYIVFYKKKNLVLSKSPLRCTFPTKEPSLTVEQLRNYCAPVGGGPGSGSERGGGVGGSVKDSAGALGKIGGANEEGYFYSKQKEQLRKIKKKLLQQAKDEGLRQKPEKP